MLFPFANAKESAKPRLSNIPVSSAWIVTWQAAGCHDYRPWA